MRRTTHLYPYIKTDDQLRNVHETLNFPEPSAPPSYCPQANDSDWKHEIIKINSLKDHTNKFGFVISGGINHVNGPWIVVTHIDSSSEYSTDNGRHQLQLFDRILAIDGTSLNNTRHDDAVYMFTNARDNFINLDIYRLNPRHIESIDVVFPSDTSEPALGITLSGGINNNSDDPGLFITNIDSNGFLASYNQFRLDDRLLEVKTSFTSANLRWLTHSKAVVLIRRICQDDSHVTFVVAHK